MWLSRVRADLRELRRLVSELIAAPGPEEEAASFELAASARRFSDTTKSVVDDKLSFSATLMRAGEVEAANRLVAEVHEEVIAEEVALIERVNEVKVAQAIRRERMTRMRMARLLATALLGSGLLASSAIAAAVSGVLADRAKSEVVGSPGTVARAADEGARADAGRRHANRNRERRVNIAGVSVGMSASEIRRYKLLTSTESDEAGLEFLLTILPDEVAEKVESAMATTTQAAATSEEAVAAPRIVEKAKKKAAKAEQAAKAEEEADEEPTDQPTEEEDPNGDEGDEGDGEDEGDEGGLPVDPSDDN
jgi:hypothetical protein